MSRPLFITRILGRTFDKANIIEMSSEFIFANLTAISYSKQGLQFFFSFNCNTESYGIDEGNRIPLK